MWQKYADFTATKAQPTSDAQEQAELQQAIRLSLGTDQDEQLPQRTRFELKYHGETAFAQCTTVTTFEEGRCD